MKRKKRKQESFWNLDEQNDKIFSLNVKSSKRKLFDLNNTKGNPLFNFSSKKGSKIFDLGLGKTNKKNGHRIFDLGLNKSTNKKKGYKIFDLGLNKPTNKKKNKIFDLNVTSKRKQSLFPGFFNTSKKTKPNTLFNLGAKRKSNSNPNSLFNLGAKRKSNSNPNSLFNLGAKRRSNPNNLSGYNNIKKKSEMMELFKPIKMTPAPFLKKETIFQKELNPWGDADMDGSVNHMDCDPRDVAKDGFLADMASKISEKVSSAASSVKDFVARDPENTVSEEIIEDKKDKLITDEKKIAEKYYESKDIITDKTDYEKEKISKKRDYSEEKMKDDIGRLQETKEILASEKETKLTELEKSKDSSIAALENKFTGKESTLRKERDDYNQDLDEKRKSVDEKRSSHNKEIKIFRGRIVEQEEHYSKEIGLLDKIKRKNKQDKDNDMKEIEVRMGRAKTKQTKDNLLKKADKIQREYDNKLQSHNSDKLELDHNYEQKTSKLKGNIKIKNKEWDTLEKDENYKLQRIKRDRNSKNKQIEIFSNEKDRLVNEATDKWMSQKTAQETKFEKDTKALHDKNLALGKEIKTIERKFTDKAKDLTIAEKKELDKKLKKSNEELGKVETQQKKIKAAELHFKSRQEILKTEDPGRENLKMKLQLQEIRIQEKIAKGKKPTIAELKALETAKRNYKNLYKTTAKRFISQITGIPYNEREERLKLVNPKTGRYTQEAQLRGRSMQRTTGRMMFGAFSGGASVGATGLLASDERALSSEPMQSKGRGRPSGTYKGYKVNGLTVSEDQFQDIRMSENRKRKKLGMETLPIGTIQINVVNKKIQQTGESRPLISMEGARENPNVATQSQVQEQFDDNVLNAPNVEQGELKQTAGVFNEDPRFNILNAPDIQRGGLRNVGQFESVASVKLGERPNANPYGEEYSEIEPGSGRTLIKRRPQEKWATGEAL